MSRPKKTRVVFGVGVRDDWWPLFSEYEGVPPALAVFETRREAVKWAKEHHIQHPLIVELSPGR